MYGHRQAPKESHSPQASVGALPCLGKWTWQSSNRRCKYKLVFSLFVLLFFVVDTVVFFFGVDLGRRLSVCDRHPCCFGWAGRVSQAAGTNGQLSTTVAVVRVPPFFAVRSGCVCSFIVRPYLHYPALSPCAVLYLSIAVGCCCCCCCCSFSLVFASSFSMLFCSFSPSSFSAHHHWPLPLFPFTAFGGGLGCTVNGMHCCCCFCLQLVLPAPFLHQAPVAPALSRSHARNRHDRRHRFIALLLLALRRCRPLLFLPPGTLRSAPPHSSYHRCCCCYYYYYEQNPSLPWMPEGWRTNQPTEERSLHPSNISHVCLLPSLPSFPAAQRKENLTQPSVEPSPAVLSRRPVPCSFPLPCTPLSVAFSFLLLLPIFFVFFVVLVVFLLFVVVGATATESTATATTVSGWLSGCSFPPGGALFPQLTFFLSILQSLTRWRFLLFVLLLPYFLFLSIVACRFLRAATPLLPWPVPFLRTLFGVAQPSPVPFSFLPPRGGYPLSDEPSFSGSRRMKDEETNVPWGSGLAGEANKENSVGDSAECGQLVP